MADQGTVYAGFIETELQGEQDRRTAHEARGSAIVSTSSGFVTLIFAVAAIVLGGDYQFTDASIPFIVLVLVLFVASGIAGLLANKLYNYDVPKTQTMKTMLSTQWTDTETTARNNTSWLRLATLTTLRIGNNKKANSIVWGQAFQLAAIVLLLVTVVIELT